MPIKRKGGPLLKDNLGLQVKFLPQYNFRTVFTFLPTQVQRREGLGAGNVIPAKQNLCQVWQLPGQGKVQLSQQEEVCLRQEEQAAKTTHDGLHQAIFKVRQSDCEGKATEKGGEL